MIDLKINKVTFPTPLEQVDSIYGNLDVFIELEDGHTYTFVVSTPLSLLEFMNNEELDFIPPAQPDIIVKEITLDNIISAVENYADGDAFWLKILSVADHSKEAFDMDRINDALDALKNFNDSLAKMD